MAETTVDGFAGKTSIKRTNRSTTVAVKSRIGKQEEGKRAEGHVNHDRTSCGSYSACHVGLLAAAMWKENYGECRITTEMWELKQKSSQSANKLWLPTAIACFVWKQLTGKYLPVNVPFFRSYFPSKEQGSYFQHQASIQFLGALTHHSFLTHLPSHITSPLYFFCTHFFLIHSVNFFTS